VPEPEQLLVFVGAALLLLVVPGPSVLYIVTRSIDQGRKAGLVSMLGIEAGALVHVAAAALGLSAILMTSAAAFSVVKYAGAAYLVFLGVRRLMTPEEPLRESDPAREPVRRLFWQGVLVNALNPKTALFFLAFIPQFVDLTAPIAPQVLLLGAIFILLALLSDGVYALVASGAGRWLRRSVRFAKARRYVTGGVYLGLGVTAAASGSRPETR
jgi:threonine/homoserine/homoserine lactone efflux protein